MEYIIIDSDGSLWVAVFPDNSAGYHVLSAGWSDGRISSSSTPSSLSVLYAGPAKKF